MTSHPVPRKISFTGSVATGKHVGGRGRPDLKRVTLELGGNDPAIILDDVDPAAIADKLFWGAFGNNGQICSAVKRVYVPESLYGDVVDALAERARAVKVGDGTEEGTQLGPDQQPARSSNGSASSSPTRSPAGPRPPPAASRSTGRLLLRADHPGQRRRRHAHRRRGAVRPGAAGHLLPQPRRRHRARQRHPLRAVGIGVERRSRARRRGRRPTRVRHRLGQRPPGARPHQPFGGAKWSGIGVENGPWGYYGFTELQVHYRAKA